jgi:hypothetical protein
MGVPCSSEVESLRERALGVVLLLEAPGVATGRTLPAGALVL